MTGVLIVYHGSRLSKAEQTFQEIIKLVKQKLPDMCIETGAMEFTEKTIEKGLETLKQKGIKQIQVVPYFLFEGVHIKKDIPEIIKVFKSNNPNIQVELKSTLGFDARLADIVVDRVNFLGV